MFKGRVTYHNMICFAFENSLNDFQVLKTLNFNLRVVLRKTCTNCMDQCNYKLVTEHFYLDSFQGHSISSFAMTRGSVVEWN